LLLIWEKRKVELSLKYFNKKLKESENKISEKNQELSTLNSLIYKFRMHYYTDNANENDTQDTVNKNMSASFQLEILLLQLAYQEDEDFKDSLLNIVGKLDPDKINKFNLNQHSAETKHIMALHNILYFLFNKGFFDSEIKRTVLNKILENKLKVKTDSWFKSCGKQ
jgi:hypothetical protein